MAWARLKQAIPGLGIALRAFLDKHHPVLAQIVPMRRCNLACGYCNEYDKVSQPVPLPTVLAWLDKLAKLGTEIVTVSGGEPMLHPDIEAIIVARHAGREAERAHLLGRRDQLVP
jgi:uncharacterized radical SAM superfamily Fe-S cluster-containing enzyme